MMFPYQVRALNDTPASPTESETLAAALQKVAGGDRAAFEEVYRRTSAKLFGVCLRILPVRQEAEEALQEAYLSVWRRASSFDAARGTAMTWLITLTRNRAVDRLRAGGRIAAAPVELAEAMPDDAPLASALMEAGEDERRLAHCIGTLETGEAGLIRTAFFEGSTYAELATRAAIPLGTIKSRIRRALAKLRACLA
jgi:RNA polymerase sigma factor (sigma-70 family)